MFQCAEPAVFRFLADGVAVSEVLEFPPRAVVTEGSKANGLQVRSAQVSFVLHVPAGIEMARAAIELVAKSEGGSSVSVEKIACGQPCGFPNEVFLGLNLELWV